MKFDPYMRALSSVNELSLLKEHLRLEKLLAKLGDLDFDSRQSWTITDQPHYKGCDPMKTGREPIHCD